MTAVLVDPGEYQVARLTAELTALVGMGAHPCLIDGARIRWGATPEETDTILTRIRGRHEST